MYHDRDSELFADLKSRLETAQNTYDETKKNYSNLWDDFGVAKWSLKYSVFSTLAIVVWNIFDVKEGQVGSFTVNVVAGNYEVVTIFLFLFLFANLQIYIRSTAMQKDLESTFFYRVEEGFERTISMSSSNIRKLENLRNKYTSEKLEETAAEMQLEIDQNQELINKTSPLYDQSVLDRKALDETPYLFSATCLSICCVAVSISLIHGRPSAISLFLMLCCIILTNADRWFLRSYKYLMAQAR